MRRRQEPDGVHVSYEVRRLGGRSLVFAWDNEEAAIDDATWLDEHQPNEAPHTVDRVIITTSRRRLR